MYVIVIPTYNERANITRLVAKIDRLYGHDKALSILVADDSSPDGTRQALETYLAKKPTKLSVEIITKTEKTGLADAYFNAFRYLLKSRPDLKGVVQMDADFSHKPEYLAVQLQNLREGYDLSVGSRYITGGGIQNWGWYRVLLSRGGNLLNVVILSPKLHDYTGGFNGLSKRALRYVLKPGRITSGGYYFLTEMKYRLLTANRFKICEFPIIFTDRTAGQSKMGGVMVLQSLKYLIKLRFSSAR